MVLAVYWTVKTGEGLYQHQLIKIKKHGRKVISVFRYGLDFLRSVVHDLDLKHWSFFSHYNFCPVLRRMENFIVENYERIFLNKTNL